MGKNYCNYNFDILYIYHFKIKKREKRGGRKKNKVVKENTWFTLKSCSCAPKAYQDLKMKTK